MSTKPTSKKTSLWSDAERVKNLAKEMEVFKINKPKEVEEVVVEEYDLKFPEAVLLKAIAEVLATVGWYDYEQFNKTVRRILTGPPRSVPFGVRTKDQRTGKFDFWLIRGFVNVANEPHYEVEDVKYDKLSVLMSWQFRDYLNDYCRHQLNDEVQFWTFTGTYKDTQQLDMSRFYPNDLDLLLATVGDTEADNLVMFQFKKKKPAEKSSE